MASLGSSLKQVNGKEAWKSTPKRWSTAGKNKHVRGNKRMSVETSLNQLCGSDGNNTPPTAARKRVMVVVDHSVESKHALIWALTHVANKADLFTLLHVVPPHTHSSHSTSLFNCLISLCKDCRPEVEVEVLVIEGPKLSTVMSQVKKLEVSVLVLGQKKPSLLFNCLCGNSRSEEFVEHCIQNVECLTIGVGKRSQGMNGYLISTKWQKNFWLLA